MTVSVDINIDLGDSTPASTSNAPPYELSVDGFDEDFFRVHALKGKEAISETYAFDVVVTADAAGDEVERIALGQRAVLTFNVGKAPRAFYGIVGAVRLDKVHDANGSTKFHIRVVPRLWLLKQKKRSRIYQNMRVPDVVSSVLLEAGIGTQLQLLHDHPVREYITQYEETDYRFIKRLLAEAGIYFYFAEGPPVDAKILAAASLVGFAGSAAGSAVGALAGSAIGSMVSSVAAAATPLVPGETILCGDDAMFYPGIGGESLAGLAVAGAVSMASGAASAFGAGAAFGGASAAVSAVAGGIASALSSSPTLYFLAMQQTTTSPLDKVTRFSVRTQVRSNSANYREYDPDRPHVRLSSAAYSSQPFPPSALDIAAAAATTAGNLAASVAPGPLGDAGASLAQNAGAVAGAIGGLLGQGTTPGLEVYEHHADYLFPKWGFGSEEAARILRQKRRRVLMGDGASGCPDLAAGHRFTLSDHPAGQLDRGYVVTSVEHRGQCHPQPGIEWRVYSNTFECTPDEVAYVPSRPKRPNALTMLTATVVGPAGQEIYPDPVGQIKVQFHWDRQGIFNDQSSCWVRTMHAWAGAGFGEQFIPRVGMEVVVVFEGGDPDKPLVTGCVYNGTHPTPFSLPGDKTRSGWRTQSSPGGGGFNELSFQDAAAREQIYLHAQRNLDEVVEQNHTLLIKMNEFIRVQGNRMDTIEKNLEEHVKGDHTSTVDGNRVDVVTGNRDNRVSGMLVTRVEGKERRAVTGTTDLEYADDVTTRIKGCQTTIVGRHDKKRSWVTHAEGTAKLSSLDATEVSSEKELVLRVGKSFLRMTKDQIELGGSSITVKGAGGGLSASDDGLALSSKGDAQIVVKKKFVIKTDGASFAMEKEVKVDGDKILLNSPDKATDPPPKEAKQATKVELRDQYGNVLAQQRFLATLSDGTEVSGMTDKDGNAELELTTGGTIRFPDAKESKPE